jgi:hypothetical protein
MKLWNGWGTQLFGLVEILKTLGAPPATVLRYFQALLKNASGWGGSARHLRCGQLRCALWVQQLPRLKGESWGNRPLSEIRDQEKTAG